MLPGHSPSPAHPEMGGVGSPAQPAAHSGMYNQPHASPHSAVQQPIPPRPGGPHLSGGPHAPGGPHPPGPSPGMPGLSPAMAPSPSNQAPPSVQSHEEAQEYDRKVRVTKESTGLGCGLPDVWPHAYSNVFSVCACMYVCMYVHKYIGDAISLQLHCSVLFWNDLTNLLCFVLFCSILLLAI